MKRKFWLAVDVAGIFLTFIYIGLSLGAAFALFGPVIGGVIALLSAIIVYESAMDLADIMRGVFE